MSHQFLSIELWSAGGSKRVDKRRWSAREILAEMNREPGHCSHVPSPQPPQVLFGSIPDPDEIEALAADLKDTTGRSMRSRARVLGVMVASYHEPRGKASSRDEEAFGADVVAFARKQFGDNLRAVVAHRDEAHYHLHVAFTAPLRAGRLAWEEVHSGVAAERAARDAGKTKREQKQAFSAGLRWLQDEFYKSVAVKHGQTRTGPRRQRLTRQEWKARENEAELIKEVVSGRVDLMKEVVRLRAENTRLRAALTLTNAQAEKFRAQAERLLAWLRRYVKERARRIAKAQTPFAALERDRQREHVLTRQKRRSDAGGMV